MAGIELSKEKAAQFFGVDTRTVDKWLRAGCPGAKTARGVWSLNSARVAEWLKLRERESALGDLATIDEAEARRRKLAAEASREELKLAIEEGKVVAIADYEAEASKIAGAIRAKALNYAAKMAPLVMQAESIAEAKSMLDAGMREVLHELSDLDGMLPEQAAGAEEPEGSEPEIRETAVPSPGPERQRLGRSRKKAQP